MDAIPSMADAPFHEPLPNPFLSAAPQVAAGTAAAPTPPIHAAADTYPRGFDPEQFYRAIEPRRTAR